MMGVEELSNSGKQASTLLAVMPEGIGDLSFGSEEWVSVADVTNENYEISYSRGIPAGEYIVNVHQYGPLPVGTIVNAKVVVSVRTQLEAARQILTTDVELSRQGQEETAFRFRLDQEGSLVPDSVNKLSRRLVTEE